MKFIQITHAAIRARLCALLVALSGCPADPPVYIDFPDGGPCLSSVDPFGIPPTCTSGTMWTQGNFKDPRMRPGLACFSCHGASDMAPGFTLAGTIYPTAHEPDECNGGGAQMGQATVVIKDSTGMELTLAANTVGNFFWAADLMPPYTAKVVYQGCVRIMATPQMTGDCNSCHRQIGANGAPGRIVLP